MHLAPRLQEKNRTGSPRYRSGTHQRGGEPCPYDRVLSTRLGAAAAKLIQEKKYGYMVAVKNNEITEVPLEGGCRQVKDGRPELLHDSGSQDDRHQLWRRITAILYTGCRKQGVKEYVIHCTVPQMASGGI